MMLSFSAFCWDIDSENWMICMKWSYCDIWNKDLMLIETKYVDFHLTNSIFQSIKSLLIELWNDWVKVAKRWWDNQLSEIKIFDMNECKDLKIERSNNWCFLMRARYAKKLISFTSFLSSCDDWLSVSKSQTINDMTELSSIILSS
jgi:hypothetical protein